MFKKIACTLFLFSSLLASNASYGSTTCYTDRLGYTTCNDNHGNRVTGYTDSLGYSSFSDNKGNTSHCYTDKLGYTTCD